MKKSFLFLSLIIVLLAFGTVVEQCAGVAAAHRWCYTAPWTLALWLLTVLAAWRGAVRGTRGAVRWLHAALVVVLAGAAITHFTAREGRIELSEGHPPVSGYFTAEERVAHLPFALGLERAETVRDTVSMAVRDYVSHLTAIAPDGSETPLTVATNRPATYRGYRFTPRTMGRGCCTLSVMHDPAGIAVTYVGYALLLAAMAAMAFSPGGPVRRRLSALRPAALRPAVWRRVADGATTVATFALIIAPLRRFATTGHVPLSSGHDVLLLTALVALLVTRWLRSRVSGAREAGWIVAALCVAVAVAQGEASPTSLPPVLSSWLLPVHVTTVVAAYALLAVMSVLGAAALCGGSSRGREGAAAVCRALLTPAVLLLMAGIFLGAVWGNMSWGRYWGWDPKETWALITLLLYVVPLHLPALKRREGDRALLLYLFAAFAAVAFTFLGVNYWMAGLHSYA